jgi:methionyl aminopeptidase
MDRLRAACAAARRVLDGVGQEVRAGVTTDELDAVAHELYLAEGGYPSPLGYRGFPKSICTSVNEVVAHGIPDDRLLADGDIVNCDITIYLDGMHGDCSATFLVGDVAPEVRRLVEVTAQSLDAGVAAVRPGRRIRDIGRAIQK